MYLYSSDSKTVKKWSLIITLSFITAWILFIYTFSYKSTFKIGLENSIFYKGSSNHKQISLTFEIEEGTSILPSILKILEKEKVNNATFFVNGQWAEKHPDLVKKIIKDGHEIGITGYSLESYEGKSVEEITKDLNKCTTVLQRLGINSIQLLRPPNAYYDKTVLKAATNNNYTIVHWSVQSMDTQNINATKITDNVVSTVQNGDVISLHSNDYSLQTKKALPFILRLLKEKGYANVSVSELISNATSKTKIIN